MRTDAVLLVKDCKLGSKDGERNAELIVQLPGWWNLLLQCDDQGKTIDGVSSKSHVGFLPEVL